MSSFTDPTQDPLAAYKLYLHLAAASDVGEDRSKSALASAAEASTDPATSKSVINPLAYNQSDSDKEGVNNDELKKQQRSLRAFGRMRSHGA